MIPIREQIHPWMQAWVGVMEHPFFAVTDAAGRFEIKGLPAGAYTLEVWHERFVSVRGEVVVRAGADASVDLTLSEFRK